MRDQLLDRDAETCSGLRGRQQCIRIGGLVLELLKPDEIKRRAVPLDFASQHPAINIHLRRYRPAIYVLLVHLPFSGAYLATPLSNHQSKPRKQRLRHRTSHGKIRQNFFALEDRCDAPARTFDSRKSAVRYVWHRIFSRSADRLFQLWPAVCYPTPSASKPRGCMRCCRRLAACHDRAAAPDRNADSDHADHRTFSHDEVVVHGANAVALDSGPTMTAAELFLVLRQRRSASPAIVIAQKSFVAVFLLPFDPAWTVRADPSQRGMNDSGSLLISVFPRPTLQA